MTGQSAVQARQITQIKGNHLAYPASISRKRSSKACPQATSIVRSSLNQPLAELACTRFGWCAKLRPTRACRVGSGPESMDLGAGVYGPRGREQPVWLCASRHLGRHDVLSRPAAHAMHSCPAARPPTSSSAECFSAVSSKAEPSAGVQWSRILMATCTHVEPAAS